MAYERKYTKEQLIALARERGLYPPEDTTDEELRELRPKQDEAKRMSEPHSVPGKVRPLPSRSIDFKQTRLAERRTQ